MRKLGFRRLLPVVLTGTQVCLVVAGGAPRATHLYAPTVVQEGAVQWNLDPPPPPTSRKIMGLLNLPAIFAALPVAALIDSNSTVPTLVITTLFVPLLWYAVGYWIDGQLGFVDRNLKSDSDLRQFARRLSALGAACFLIVGIAGAIHGPYRNLGYWGATTWILWSGLWFLIAVSCIRRRREKTP